MIFTMQMKSNHTIQQERIHFLKQERKTTVLNILFFVIPCVLAMHVFVCVAVQFIFFLIPGVYVCVRACVCESLFKKFLPTHYESPRNVHRVQLQPEVVQFFFLV